MVEVLKYQPLRNKTAFTVTINWAKVSNGYTVLLQRSHSWYLHPDREIRVKDEGKWKSLSRVTLGDPLDYTVHGILQARILEWVTIPISKGSSQPRDRTQVSCTAGRFFTSWATREMNSSSENSEQSQLFSFVLQNPCIKVKLPLVAQMVKHLPIMQVDQG